MYQHSSYVKHSVRSQQFWKGKIQLLTTAIEWKGTHKKSKYKCIEHDYVFEQYPTNHVRLSNNILTGKRGCVYCSSKGHKLTNEQSIYKANEKHGDRYDYSKWNYINSREECIIICEEHGPFPQTPNSHFNGRGCPICAEKDRRDKKRSKTTIPKLNKLFTERNGSYKLITPYTAITDRILATCSNDHTWDVSIQSLLYAESWCPYCASSTNVGENLCRIIIESHFGIPFQNTKPPELINPITGRLLELDLYNAEKKLAFEYGCRYHRNPEQSIRDHIKKKLCKKLGIKLIHIPELKNLTEEKMYNHVRKILYKNNIFIDIDIGKLNFSNGYINSIAEKQYKKLEEKIKKFNGKIISGEYIHCYSEFILQCSNEHIKPIQYSSFMSIKSQHEWCLKCSGIEKSKSAKIKRNIKIINLCKTIKVQHIKYIDHKGSIISYNDKKYFIHRGLFSKIINSREKNFHKLVSNGWINKRSIYLK